jgi:uncharacterized membrane protein YeaQ/YmgE (transglycosylase-associated protein family)
MSELQLSPEVQQLFNDILVWIGFGTVVGLVARGLMPGRDPAGAITTLVLGIAGSVIGCGCVGFFIEAGRLKPTSPLGMVVAVVGAFLLLGFYRLYGDLLPWKLPDPHARATGASSPSYEAYRKRYGSANYED